LLSNLALIAFTVFVFVLLRFDRKQASGVTKALWIPTVWILYIGSKPLNRWFPSSGATVESSPLDRGFLIMLLFASLWILIRRHLPVAEVIRKNKPLMILFAFMTISVIWSSAPGESLARWVREILAVAMALVVISEPSPRQAVESLLRRITYVLIPYSVLLIKYFPYYGREYGRWTGEVSWVGVTLQKNGLGRLCLIAMLYLLWTFIRRWRKKAGPVPRYQIYCDVLVLLMAIWLTKGPSINSYSATGLVSMTLGLLVYGGLQIMRKTGFGTVKRALTLLLLIAIIVGVTTPFTSGSAVGSFSSYLGRNRTLTDRTSIWAFLLPVAMRTPLLGRGLGGVYTLRSRESFRVGQLILTEAHNGYLDLILAYGFIGLILASIFLISSGWKAQLELSCDYEWGSIWICFLVAALIHNISESSLHTFQSQLTAVLLMFSVSSGITAPEADEQDGAGIEKVQTP